MSVPDCEFPPQRELLAGFLQIGDLDRLQVADGAAGHGGAVQRHRFLPRQSFGLAERCGNPEHLVIDDGDLDNMCPANVGGVLGNRVQHRLHVTRRIGDHAENVADRGLLLLRLLQLESEPRDLGIMGTRG